MECTSGFGRLSRFGDMTLSPSVAGVSTALAQALFCARPESAPRTLANRPAPANDRGPVPADRGVLSSGPLSGRVA
jgi:hypothetical protein